MHVDKLTLPIGGELSATDMRRIVTWIAAGNAHAFYVWSKWLTVREEVLRYDKHECQHCKARGRYKKAVLVHHVKHLKARPDLALSIWDTQSGAQVRQLVSLCKQCHEAEHPERMCTKRGEKRVPLTIERWD